MSESTTKPTKVDVNEYLDALTDPAKAEDSRTLIELMGGITGEPAVMWGPSMIGFGFWHYTYPTGNHGDLFFTGFAPRAKALTIYLTSGVEPVEEELARLGKHQVGKGCLYIKRLSDVDLDVLRELITKSVWLTKAQANTD